MLNAEMEINNLNFMLPPLCRHRGECRGRRVFVFCTRASNEFRQIRVEPSAARDRCSSPELSHSSSAGLSRFEITPVFSSAIISPWAAHRGHHAGLEFRPRRTNKESVAIVIFVCFTMSSLLFETVRVTETGSLPGRHVISPF